MKLLTMMAKACHYAQQHIDDLESWTDPQTREYMLECTSYQMACFLAQNTAEGRHGIEWDVVYDDLLAQPGKTEEQWADILGGIAKELGGWLPGSGNDGIDTLEEARVALNHGGVDDVKQALKHWHPTLLGQLHLATHAAYHLRTAGHPEYEADLRKIKAAKGLL